VKKEGCRERNSNRRMPALKLFFSLALHETCGPLPASIPAVSWQASHLLLHIQQTCLPRKWRVIAVQYPGILGNF